MLGIVYSLSNFNNVCIFKQYSESRAPLTQISFLALKVFGDLVSFIAWHV